LGERTSEEPRVHDHVRLYSSASPSLKSTKGVLMSPTQRPIVEADNELEAEKIA